MKRVYIEKLSSCSDEIVEIASLSPIRFFISLDETYLWSNGCPNQIGYPIPKDRWVKLCTFTYSYIFCTQYKISTYMHLYVHMYMFEYFVEYNFGFFATSRVQNTKKKIY